MAVTRGGWERADEFGFRVSRPEPGHYWRATDSDRVLRDFVNGLAQDPDRPRIWVLRGYHDAEGDEVGSFYNVADIENALDNVVRVVTRAVRALAGIPA